MSEKLKFVPPAKESEDPRTYTKREEKISCDKGSHAERSKANQPNHNKWWKKQEKQVYPPPSDAQV